MLSHWFCEHDQVVVEISVGMITYYSKALMVSEAHFKFDSVIFFRIYVENILNHFKILISVKYFELKVLIFPLEVLDQNFDNLEL